MSTLLQPLPDHDLLKLSEVAAFLGMSTRHLAVHAARGRFPGAFRTPALQGAGHWRIPRAAVLKVGRELGMPDA